MKVSYFSGLNRISEYVCFEHPGIPRKRAAQWWIMRGAGVPPKSTAEALMRVSQLVKPRAIKVQTNTKYPCVTQPVF
jgi:DNA repair protein RadD